MARRIEEIESELLQLDRQAREKVWADEAEARYADFLAGKTSAVDGDEVFARARARNAEKMSALMTEEYLAARAKRASRSKFEAILAKVPDVEPEEFDRLPANYKKRRRSGKRAG